MVSDAERELLHFLREPATEHELRRRLNGRHPASNDPDLLDTLADLEARSLIVTQLWIVLTPRGREEISERRPRRKVASRSGEP